MSSPSVRESAVSSNRLPKRARCSRSQMEDPVHAAPPRALEPEDPIPSRRYEKKASASSTKECEPDHGPVLAPSSQHDKIRFDTNCVASPVVVPPSTTGTLMWQCYYYGNSGIWANGMPSAMPTGWIGLAESNDGIHWVKVTGSEENGSILAPTGNAKDWDGVHVGVGAVVRVSKGVLHMYYFGGDGEKLSLSGDMPPKAGMRMRIGRAESFDNGRTWTRLGLALDYDEKEGFFATMPRVTMIPAEKASNDRTLWTMTYHSFNGKTHSVFSASSRDSGNTWSRDGRLLGPGPQGSWDEMGPSCRALICLPKGRWAMVYEAANKNWQYCLGLAHLERKGDGSLKCVKAVGPNFAGSGGPIVKPGCAPLGKWTSQLVGTPYLVAVEDGSVRLYFCSKTSVAGHSIGLLISDTGDIGPDCWRTPCA